MASNPAVSVQFLDGGLRGEITLAEEVCLKVAPATGGPYNVPVRCSSTSAVVSRFLHGQLVGSGSHHCDYSGPFYAVRCRASTAGTVGSVTKTPASGILAGVSGNPTIAVQSYTLHAQAAAGAALNLTTGWSAPASPLRMKITLTGGGVASHTQTVTYVDNAGTTTTEAVACTAAGDFYTTGDVASVISVTSNIDPGGTSDYSCTHAGPADRYEFRLRCAVGGVLGVTGGTTPTYQLSLDDGRTYSRTFSMPSTGVVDLLSYAGGQTQQTTGLKATLSAGSIGATQHGGLKVAGADTNGDVVYNFKAASVTVAHVISGMGTSLSVGVVGSAITVNCATDGGGAVTSTATLVAAAVNGSAAAAALCTAVASGTGASLVAAGAATGSPNGALALTPKVEGVTFRTVNGGASQTASVSASASAKTVTLYVTTDASGNQTTTAAQAVILLAANSTTAALLTAVASGSGAGIVGCLGTYASLPVSVASGELWSWSTTPPKWSNADLAETLAALLANASALSRFSVLHVLGDCADADVVTVGTFLSSAASQRRQFKMAVLDGTYMGSTAEATWAAALKTTYATRSTSSGICAGECNTANSAYGTVDRRGISTAYVARLMTCPISELPSHVDCDTTLGTKNALDGVLERSNDGDAPLWQTEDALADLNTSNFVTLRTHPGRSGIYVRQGLCYASDGSDYVYETNRRVANVAAALAYDEGLRYLNANLLADPQTGQLAEGECRTIEAQVGGRLRKKLVGNDNGRQHASSVTVTVDRGTNYVSTGQVPVTVKIVPRAPATDITIRVGFSATE